MDILGHWTIKIKDEGKEKEDKDKDEDCFKYLCSNFSGLSEGKVKVESENERKWKIIRDNDFMKSTTTIEKKPGRISLTCGRITKSR